MKYKDLAFKAIGIKPKMTTIQKEALIHNSLVM